MSRKRKNKDYQRVLSAAINEQERLARYVKRKHGRKLDAEELTEHSVHYEILYRFYRALLELVVDELRQNIRDRANTPDDIVRNYVPYISALLTFSERACEDFMDVFVFTPKAFQDMFISDQLRETLDELNTVTRDVNELSKQRMKVLAPDRYAACLGIASNPPIWMNMQRLFMPVAVIATRIDCAEN